MPAMIELMSGNEYAALKNMNLDELTSLCQQYKGFRQQCREACLRIQAEMESRQAQADAMRKLDRMSAAEREAFRQLIAPNGVQSNGGVGTPGH